jgi:hypothetical protein
LPILIPGSVRTAATFYGQDKNGSPQWLDLVADIRDNRIKEQFPGYDKQKGVAAKLPYNTPQGVQWKHVWLNDLVGTGYAEDSFTRGDSARLRVGIGIDQVDVNAIKQFGVAFELHSQSLGGDNPAPVQPFGQNTMPAFRMNNPYNVPLPSSGSGWWQVHVNGRSWLFNNAKLAQQTMQEAWDRGDRPYVAQRYSGPDWHTQRRYPFSVNPMGPSYR